MATQEAVGPEVEELLAGMARDLVGEGDAKAPPVLSVLAPDLRLLADAEAGLGKQKGSREVGPQGFAAEVGDVDVVPRSLRRLVGEVGEWVLPFFAQVARSGLDDDPVGFEDRALVLAGEVHDQPLVMGARGDDYVFEHVRTSFE